MSALWFALALPLIALMYLLKRKYVDTPVSSHMLWNKALRELEANRPWQKLRARLLMLIQLLAAALLVLALAGPAVMSERGGARHLVLVVDRSASMSARDAADVDGAPLRRLDAAKRSALAALDDAPRDAVVTLLAVGERPETLAEKSANRNAVREAIERLEPTYGAAAYRETLSLAAALTRDDGPDAAIRWFTDGQVPEVVSDLVFASPVAVVEPETANGAGNAAVSHFGVKRNAADGAVSAAASIRYWGESPAAVRAAVFADGRLAAEKRIEARPGGAAPVYFEGLPPAEWYKLTVDAGDAFAADDASYAFLAEQRPKRVLVVGDGNMFLEKALRLAGAEVTLVAPDAADAWAASYRNENAMDAIVIDVEPEAWTPSEAWREMAETTPALFIRFGYEGRERAAPAGPYTVETHPATRYLSFADTHVAAVYEPVGAPPGKPIVASREGVPLLIAGEEAGVPRLTVTFALEGSDWPLRTEFPVFVLGALDWLTASHSGSLGRAVAGERLSIAFAQLAADARWERGDPAGEPIRAELADGKPAEGQTAPAEPGLYRLVETDESGRVLAARWLDVVSDPRESAPSGFDGAFARGESAEAGGAESEEPRTAVPMWRWAALLALAAVVWEWGVYRRGTTT
ncbi:VWA domain-containing protein [Paenibacillus sp.]|uniref:vWA domain-containing protein n=1 Tax=Paenibacillus sp. TaxID=58172 RepID=UPI002D3EFF7B|nr:VWA domain-containing protein [Paenibacillus sp.]HZG86833.1 VWA domain-containing protein [Paenibacillus sp.]